MAPSGDDYVVKPSLSLVCRLGLGTWSTIRFALGLIRGSM
jgi:hypothetical protein